MGQQQSKEELLHQQVNYGNIEGIKSLCRDGAGLEWIDREGKTPLIVACMKPELYNVAKTLLELGANVNSYRPGRNGGTPLHHAAKRGLDHTVKLLLSYGANALVINDDCQTALDVARTKAFTNVVRTIESHMCLFAGWMREFYGPGFLEVFAPQLLSRKIWVVVYPCGSRNPAKPFKLELAIYSGLQDAQPRSVIALWKATLEEPKFYHTDTSVIIVDNSSPTISKGRKRRRTIYTSQEGRCRPRSRRQTRIKLAPGQENDRVQLQLFCDACKGITQTMPPAFQHSTHPPIPATAPPAIEDMELAMAINASIESAMHEMPPPLSGPTVIDTNASTSGSVPPSKLPAPAPAPAPAPSTETSGVPILPTPVPSVESTASAASAPPVDTEIIEDGPVQYPSIDSSPIEFTSNAEEKVSKTSNGGKEDGTSGSCVICLDAPVEGACIPCGHMAGCMSCLKEIQGKKWGCPVCRAKIDQVIRLYAV